MASNINFQDINENFPIPGIEQPSQGFRDNFSVIKNSLGVAKLEIETLQDALENFEPPGTGGITIDDVSEFLVESQYLTQPQILNLLTTEEYTTVTVVNNIVSNALADSGFVTIDNINTLLPELGEITQTKLDSVITTGAPNTSANPTKIITLSNSSLIKNFVKGQKVRIFGGGTTLTGPSVPVLSSLTASGNIVGTTLVEYRVCQFNFSNGKISPPSATLSQAVDLGAFNLINNVRLNFTRSAVTNGILVYRKTGASLFELIAILGPRDLGNSLSGVFIDYATFDFNPWSLKSSTTNAYIETTGLVHFPRLAPSAVQQGWVDTEIDDVNEEFARITLKDEFFLNPQVTIAHDDTAVIQAAIFSFAEKNQNILKLGSKTYNVSSLIIPDNFTIIGDSKKTLIKKLPWSSTTENTNKIFKSALNSVKTGVTIENLSIDGNMQNQYLLSETDDESINYAIDLRGNSLTFENLIIKNVAGGGISSRETTDLVVFNCKILDSGMSDRYAYSPLFADLCNEILISSNIMRNFTESVDLSLARIGSVVGNIVNNCGSGIFIFGSIQLISSPNLILGPAGEFIPGPDLLNSEFDSVNIIIERDVTFVSDVYVYQENGQVVDLSPERGSIVYRVNRLRKIDNVEEIGSEILINGTSPISPFLGSNLVQGQFRFAITADKTTILKTDFSYSTLRAQDPSHMGLIYRALFVEYSTVSSVDQSVTPTINFSAGRTLYTVRLTSLNNLAVGFRVRLPGHGGTPSLNNAVGTIISLIPQTIECVIEYQFQVTVAGQGGQLQVENSFVLAKGKIQ